MPTFEGVEITTIIDVDFEVFCGTCGEGLCYESNTRRSRNRGYAQVEVNVCPSCIKEKNNEIEDLKLEISRLEEQISKLTDE
jgi:hypothetical protein